MVNKYNSILFIDHDGVFNYDLFYKEKFNNLTKFDIIPLYKVVRKYLRKLVKSKEISGNEYYKSNTCPKVISMINALCE